MTEQLDFGLNGCKLRTLDDGVTPRMDTAFCEAHDISTYGFDMHDKCFTKYVSKGRNYPPLVYYCVNNHMYHITDNENVMSLVRSSQPTEHKIVTKNFQDDNKKEIENVYVKYHIKENTKVEELNNTET